MGCLGKCFSWFRRWPAQSDGGAKVRRIAKRFGVPVLQSSPGIWSVTADRRNTYRVSLFLWCEENEIQLRAGCEILIERDLIPRDLAIVLLEENHEREVGSFQFVPQDSERFVVLGHSVIWRHWSDDGLLMLGRGMIERMQLMVCKLYAKGLIISGPEQPAPRSNCP